MPSSAASRTRCILLTLFTIACGAPLNQAAKPQELPKLVGPPRIDRAIDLGCLTPLVGGHSKLKSNLQINLEQSDSLFTPGEWGALYGQNLSPRAKLTLAGQAIAPQGMVGGALLFRMPRRIVSGTQTLTVDNGLGVASVTLPTASYVFGADTQGNALRIRRLGPEGTGFADGEVDIELVKARFQVLSPDGGFLYALQEPRYDVQGGASLADNVTAAARSLRDDGGPCDLIIVHLGAKGGPQKLGAVTLPLASRPTGMAMSAHGQMVILQHKKLMVIDASDAMQLRIVAQMPLTGSPDEREIIDAEFLADGRLLAVLEAYANQVLLIDLSDPLQPRQLQGALLSRTLDQPFSIDLAVAADGASLWVLQGPNLRLGGKRLVDGVRGAFSDVQALDFQAAQKTLGDAIVDAAMPQKSLSRVVQLSLVHDTLQLSKSIALPSALFPFFIVPDRDGSLYVSGINRSNPFADVQASPSGLLAVLQALKNATNLGTILKINTEDGRSQTTLQGLAVYYDLALLPNGQLLTSTMRLSPGYLPPRLALDWGLEIAGGPYIKLREVANTGLKLTSAIERLLPPYRYERIGAQ